MPPRPGHATMPSLSSSISSCSSASSSVLGMDPHGNRRRRPLSAGAGLQHRQQRRASFNEQVVVLSDPRQQQKSCTLSTALLDAAQHYCAVTTPPSPSSCRDSHQKQYDAGGGGVVFGEATRASSDDDNDYRWWSDESPLAVELAEDDAMLDKRPWYRKRKLMQYRRWWPLSRRFHRRRPASHAPVTPSSSTLPPDALSEKEHHALPSSCIPSHPFRRFSTACKKVVRNIVL